MSDAAMQKGELRHCEWSEAIQLCHKQNGLLRRRACHRAGIRAIRSLLVMTTGCRRVTRPQHFRPSPTMSGCRASDTAGDIRITSAWAPKMTTAR